MVPQAVVILVKDSKEDTMGMRILLVKLRKFLWDKLVFA